VKSGCLERYSTCLSPEKTRNEEIDFEIKFKKESCVAAIMKDELSAEPMSCATKNLFACQGVGIVLEGLVDKRKV